MKKAWVDGKWKSGIQPDKMSTFTRPLYSHLILKSNKIHILCTFRTTYDSTGVNEVGTILLVPWGEMILSWASTLGNLGVCHLAQGPLSSTLKMSQSPPGLAATNPRLELLISQVKTFLWRWFFMKSQNYFNSVSLSLFSYYCHPFLCHYRLN